MIESMGCLAACKERRSELELPTMYKPTCKGGWFWRSDATRGQRPTRRAENNGNGLIYQIIRYQNHDLSYPDKHVASYIHLNPYLSTTYRLNLATYNWPAPVQRTSPETVSGRSFVRSLARSFVRSFVLSFWDIEFSKLVLPNPKLAFRTPRRCAAAPGAPTHLPPFLVPRVPPLPLSRVRIAVRVTPPAPPPPPPPKRWEKALNFNYYSSHHPPTARRGGRPNWRYTTTGWRQAQRALL